MSISRMRQARIQYETWKKTVASMIDAKFSISRDVDHLRLRDFLQLRGFKSDESGYIHILDKDTRQRCEAVMAIILEQYIGRDRCVNRCFDGGIYQSSINLPDSLLAQYGFASIDAYRLVFARWIIENEANSKDPPPTVYHFAMHVYQKIRNAVGEHCYLWLRDETCKNLEAFIMTFALEDLFLLGY